MTDPIWWFYLFWVPDFLHRSHGLSLSQMRLPLLTIYVLSDIGSILGGSISGMMLHRGKSVNVARKTDTAPLRNLRDADRVRLPCGRSVGSGFIDWAGDGGASGILGESFHADFGHVSGGSGGFGDGNRWDGRSDWRDVNRESGWLRAAVDRKLHGAISDGGVGVLAGGRRDSSAGAEDGAREDLIKVRYTRRDCNI